MRRSSDLERLGLVRAVVRASHIEVSFPFTPSDVELIKSVPGRRRNAERRIWTVPHSETAIAELRSRFGGRLVLEGESSPAFTGLLERVRVCLRTREYSRRTEQAYLGWIRRYLDWRASEPARSQAAHRITVSSFLEHLALSERLASKTRNQAASAIMFLVRECWVRIRRWTFPGRRALRTSPPCSRTARRSTCSATCRVDTPWP